MGWGMGMKNESAKRGGKEGRKKEKYETEGAENEVRIGWHLLRYLAFPFALIFPHTVSLPAPAQPRPAPSGIPPQEASLSL